MSREPTTTLPALTDRSIASQEKRRQILDAAVRTFARKGYHATRGRRHRRGGRGRVRARLPLLRVEGGRARDDLPRDVDRAARGDPRRRGGRRRGSRAAAPGDGDPPALVAAPARPRARPRARGRAQPRRAAARGRDRRGLRRARADRRARPGRAASSAPTSTPRLASWILYGAIEEILTGWVLGQLPDGDDEVALAERTVVSLVVSGLSPRRRRTNSTRARSSGCSGSARSGSRSRSRRPLPICRRCSPSSRTPRRVIAAVLAAEGLFALTVPLVIGPWSDTFLTPMGRRRPFMLAAIGPMGFCLALVAFMPNIWTTAFVVMAFFFAYYVYEPPYRGLYPDLLHESVFARSQGVQHILRGIALGIALVGGGFLLSVWDPAPFLLAAVVTTAGLRRGRALGERGRRREPRLQGHSRVRRHEPRHLPATCPTCGCSCSPWRCWEGDVRRDADVRRPLRHQGTRPVADRLFDVLATVAAGYTFAAILAGPIGDRVGAAPRRLLGVDRLRDGTAHRRLRPELAELVLRDHLPGRRRRRHGDDPVVGASSSADAARAAGRDLGHRDDDEGLGAHLRAAARGAADRPLSSRTSTPRDGYQILWPFCALLVLASIPIVARVWRETEVGAWPSSSSGRRCAR